MEIDSWENYIFGWLKIRFLKWCEDSTVPQSTTVDHIIVYPVAIVV